jgi:phage portal protein BeeE
MANDTKIIYDHNNIPIKELIPNLDPGFFIPTGGQNVKSSDVTLMPYQYHAWVYAACRTIANNIARLDKYLTYSNDTEKKVTSEHEIFNLFANPNIFMMTSITFWQAVVLALLLPGGSKGDTGGQVFLVGLKKNREKVRFDRGEIPDFIYPYSGKFITPWKESDKLKGWKYEAQGEETIFFEMGEIIRINFFNPYDWLKGMSPLSAAGIALYQDVKASIYNSNFFDNDATLSGLLTSDQHLTDDQFKTYMSRWYSNYGGAGNVGKTAILGAGLKYQQYGTLHKDMQYIEQKANNLEEILAAFGLNKIAVGKYEQLNFATIREGRRMLWQDTYQPIDIQINTAINDQWIRFIDKNLILKSDYSQIEALRDDYKGRAESAAIMVEKLDFPASLAAELNDIPLTEQNLKDYPWLNERPVKPSFGAAGQVEEPDKAKSTTGIIVGKDLDEDYLEKFSDGYIEKVLDPDEKRFIKKLDRFINSQRNRMQDKVDIWLQHQGKIAKVINVSPQMFLLDSTKENDALLKIVEPLVVTQLESEKEQLIAELGELINWDVDNPTIQAYISARKEEIKAINTTTFKSAHKKIGEAIEVAVKENYTPYQTAKLIKTAISDVGEIRRNQSKMIARTETGIIHGKARFEAFHQEGFSFHQWVTATDEKVRDLHRATHRSVVEIGKVFMPVNLLYPLDTNGDPGNIINCRCVAVAYDKD